MQFPESWLREFCNPSLNTNELADVLTMGGLEVEEIKNVSSNFSNVIVAFIKEVKPHPNADKLRICKVDVGDEILSIVCGAPNARAGIFVPCAKVGAVLPLENDENLIIKEANLRGEKSFGMLCSAKELGLIDFNFEAGGLLELPENAKIGQNLKDFLKLNDKVFELKLTPNLAHCLSVYGVARELSALTGSLLKNPKFPKIETQIDDILPVKIEDLDLCGRFSGRILKNINPKVKSPTWLVQKLARCGQRSVSALVDISNYIMFELGRPTHIFDLDKIVGGLNVRFGKVGEKLKLLNGNEITINKNNHLGIIADDKNLESLAGIMGGDFTAVSDETKNIFIEAAFWYPDAIVNRSRELNFSTDAGHRFERGVDYENTIEHLEYITKLILEICGTPDTLCGTINDEKPNLPKSQNINLRITRVNKVLGTNFSFKDCQNALEKLNLNCEKINENELKVYIPSYRFDLKIEEDLIEEIIRIIGYENLPNNPPLAPIFPQKEPENKLNKFKLKRLLANLGYQETINFSFISESFEKDLMNNQNPIKLLNPMASNLNTMRSSLIPSLLKVLKFNLDRKVSQIKIFEIGRVFFKDNNILDSEDSIAGFNQPNKISGLAYGLNYPLQWSKPQNLVDFFDIKGDLETLFNPQVLEFRKPKKLENNLFHLGRVAEIKLKNNLIGILGELHPKICQEWEFINAPILFELDLESILNREISEFKNISKHQAITRDISIIVDNKISYFEIENIIKNNINSDILKSIDLFDIFELKDEINKEYKNKKSLTLRLTLVQLDYLESSFTDNEIDLIIQKVLLALKQELNIQLRYL